MLWVTYVQLKESFNGDLKRQPMFPNQMGKIFYFVCSMPLPHFRGRLKKIHTDMKLEQKRGAPHSKLTRWEMSSRRFSDSSPP